MKPIIKPVSRTLLMKELREEFFLRETNRAGNEIYVITAAECPNVMREIGRLREWAFRSAGGGTGESVDIDNEDLAPDGYKQLVVWDPTAQEIVGGYRFVICSERDQKHLSTEHYFRFTDKFRDEYLPYAIELGRSYVHPNYQSTRANAKSLYVMDNIWDGLGAIIVHNPDKKYFFGKVTIYGHYNTDARNMLMYFLHRYFPAKEQLFEPINPIEMNIDEVAMEKLFSGEDFAENHKILNRELRERGEHIPPMINSYMNVSPSMQVFDTILAPDLGELQDTCIMITIADMYAHKTERHTRGLDRKRPLRKLFDHTMIAIDNVVTGRAASSVKVALRRRRTERTRRVERGAKKE